MVLPPGMKILSSLEKWKKGEEEGQRPKWISKYKSIAPNEFCNNSELQLLFQFEGVFIPLAPSFHSTMQYFPPARLPTKEILVLWVALTEIQFFFGNSINVSKIPIYHVRKQWKNTIQTNARTKNNFKPILEKKNVRTSFKWM